MSLFSDNIRYLRTQKNISQESTATSLNITRGRYVKYEDGTTEPPFDILQRIARYHHVSIDLMLSVDMRKISIDELLKLDDNRILLPITVDQKGKSFIEIVPHKARAGYLTGYSDPQYIEELPQIQLPFLGPGKYRGFPITNDSMPPHNETSLIVGKYVENLGEVRMGKTYIIVTFNDGIVYKRLNSKNPDALTVSSDNLDYSPYQMKLSDILEIWEFACSLNTKEAAALKSNNETIEDMVRGIRKDIRAVKEQLSLPQ